MAEDIPTQSNFDPLSRVNTTTTLSFLRYHRDQLAGKPVNYYADYVLVFKYNTPASKATSEERQKDEQQAILSFEKLTTKLRKAGLEFEARKGSSGKLLLFIMCPVARVKQELENSRVQDWLSGVSVSPVERGGSIARSLSEKSADLTDSERLRLVHRIIVGAEEDGCAGLDPESVDEVDALFPIHDRKYNKKWLKKWSTSWRIKQDDLQDLRNHFGETIAFYFEFLQYYFFSLAIPTAAGMLAYFMNGEFSIVFSAFTVGWGVVFLELWKRRERELAIWWNVRNCSKVEQRRSAYVPSSTVRDSITGETIYYTPLWESWGKRAATIPVIILGGLLFSLVVGIVFAVEVFLNELYQGPFHEYLVLFPVILYSASIPYLSQVYTDLARKLNDFENHETDSEYNAFLTYKVCLVNFLVGFLSIFLVAWVYIPQKERLEQLIVSTSSIKTVHSSVGPERLQAQLMYFVLTAQAISFATEVIVPIATRYAATKAQSIKEKVIKTSTSEEQDEFVREDEKDFISRIISESKLPQYDVYEDYAEMVTQFGYVTLFSTIWTLTPLAAFVNNWVEMRSDAAKICINTRRPIPSRTDTIGPWLDNLSILTWLSSLTNTVLVYQFRHWNQQVNHDSYSYTHRVIYGIVIAVLAEHTFFLFRHFIRVVVKSVPSWVDEIVRKEEYEMKQEILKSSQTAVNQAGASQVAAEANTETPVPYGFQQAVDIGISEIQGSFKNS
ncbi:DUF590-domain-containing protein [Basidiobolus meristosporus CBS 931.73]|uniref:DUF590-domain-containing protein n=1 Tax=Basidiobolus meristosporus CBS 931.73 TaxID=1314790 RepID=A0A1Y1Z4B6_9FUNG|nr:DUF590-domain-containing protein [Basidiobolus meristosporus CBS 931.73]|eukprot:ORY05118.1 DUF590-domain-containing protein [Basidiobolus meristosporus CBS 931.73]